MGAEKKIGRPTKIPPKSQFIEACKLCETIEEVARKLDISKRSAYRYARFYGLNLNHFEIPFRYPPLPDSRRVRYMICKMFLRNHSAIETYKQLNKSLYWKRERITRILRDEGFVIYRKNACKIVKHLNGAHNKSISNELQKIIDGEVLGDGQLFSQSKDFKQKSINKPLSEYLLTFNRLTNLNKKEITNDRELKKIISEYNSLIRSLLKAQVAGFHIHKSLLEEPWIRWLANLFNKHNYSVTIVPPKKTVYMITQSTVQLHQEYKKWYSKKRKEIPTTLRLTPTTFLHWYVGDGSASKNTLTLNTQSFNEKNHKFLQELLKKTIRVKTRIQPYFSWRYPRKTLFKLCITSKTNINKIFEYLENAPKDSLSLAKQLLPWKFDCKLRKKDVYNPKKRFVADNYLNFFVKTVKKVEKNPLERSRRLNVLFPWKFPIKNEMHIAINCNKN
ncbi:MAG: hypothetical protein ACFFB5_00455 [Promethearchaeota archaeon]